MRDEELTRLLQEGVDADDPPPERVEQFRSSLRDRLDAELADGAADGGPSTDGPVEETTVVEIPPDSLPGAPRGRWWVRGGLAAAAAAVLVVVIVVAGGDGDSGDDADTVAAGPVYDAAVLPDAVVQDGDPGVTVGPASPQTLDEVWPAPYDDERAAYEDAGFLDALTVEFTQDNPLALSPPTEFNAAHRFENAEGASQALAVLDAWHRDKSALNFRQRLNTSELDVDLGDETVAIVQARNYARAGVNIGRQGVVILWRNGNVVHVLRAGQGREAGPEGIDSVIRLAEAIDARMPT